MITKSLIYTYIIFAILTVFSGFYAITEIQESTKIIDLIFIFNDYIETSENFAYNIAEKQNIITEYIINPTPESLKKYKKIKNETSKIWKSLKTKNLIITTLEKSKTNILKHNHTDYDMKILEQKYITLTTKQKEIIKQSLKNTSTISKLNKINELNRLYKSLKIKNHLTTNKIEHHKIALNLKNKQTKISKTSQTNIIIIITCFTILSLTSIILLKNQSINKNKIN